MNKTIDILGLGNALMDVIAPVPEIFISDHGMSKGARAMIDKARAESLTSIMLANNAHYSTGGTIANSLVGASALGAKTAYIGTIDDDLMGRAFAADLAKTGVQFLPQSNYNGQRTGRCLIAVTPDAERTMNTYLGASGDYDGRDFAQSDFDAAKIVFLMAYLLDAPETAKALPIALEMARRGGCTIAITLADHLCVARHQDALKNLILNHVDVVISNEAEILALYNARDIDDVIFALSETGKTIVVTRGVRGSVIIDGQNVQPIKIHKIPKCVDTTGAGDQYAAGFLAGLAAGKPLKTCGDMGALCAGNVITHFGARPEKLSSRVSQMSFGDPSML